MNFYSGKYWFVALHEGERCTEYAVAAPYLMGVHQAVYQALVAYCQSEANGVEATFRVVASPLQGVEVEGEVKSNAD